MNAIIPEDPPGWTALIVDWLRPVWSPDIVDAGSAGGRFNGTVAALRSSSAIRPRT